MSARGRGSEVIKDENYPTPDWVTAAALAEFSEAYPESPFDLSKLGAGSHWLEPCAGEGAICRVIRRTYPGAILNGNDIRPLVAPDYLNGCWTVGDALQLQGIYDVAMTNPAFSLAPELINALRPRCQWLVLLLRSSFKLGPWQNDMPDEFKLQERPEFVASEICKGNNAREGGCGWRQKIELKTPKTKTCPVCGGKVQRSTSDSSEYSWFVWTPERGRRYGRNCVMAKISAAKRGKKVRGSNAR